MNFPWKHFRERTTRRSCKFLSKVLTQAVLYPVIIYFVGLSNNLNMKYVKILCRIFGLSSTFIELDIGILHQRLPGPASSGNTHITYAWTIYLWIFPPAVFSYQVWNLKSATVCYAYYMLIACIPCDCAYTMHVLCILNGDA